MKQLSLYYAGNTIRVDIADEDVETWRATMEDSVKALTNGQNRVVRFSPDETFLFTVAFIGWRIHDPFPDPQKEHLKTIERMLREANDPDANAPWRDKGDTE